MASIAIIALKESKKLIDKTSTGSKIKTSKVKIAHIFSKLGFKLYLFMIMANNKEKNALKKDTCQPAKARYKRENNIRIIEFEVNIPKINSKILRC